MNKLNVLNTEVKTVTSREICKLTGRRHDHTMRLIRSLIDYAQIKEGQYEITPYMDMQNLEQILVKLDKPSSIIIVALQSPEFIDRLIERWDELEKQVVTQDFLLIGELRTKCQELSQRVEALEYQAAKDRNY